MEFVDPEDGSQGFREPPPPDDRLWRHPSELPAAATRRRAPAGPRPRQLWMVASVSALAASILTAGLIAAVGLVDVESTGVTPAVERELVRPQITTVGAAGTSVVDIADKLAPTIVQLRAGAASGSGIIVRSDGHILTSARVVQGARDVDVVTASGRKLTGRVVGTDRDTDTAVVKVDGGPFAVTTLGTATDLKLGQTAIAIGSPLGAPGGPSVTVGVVSGLHRQVKTATDGPTLVDMVQTDAPISAGSSGGALVDDNGAVIGVITVAPASSEGPGALGFATPIDAARAVAEELMATGRVVHVWLGVEGSDVDGTTAGELQVESGAMVAQVSGGSPAQRAGLATRDVIVAVDGKPVKSMSDLVVALRARAPGDAVTLDVMRDRQHRSMNVVLVPRPG